jgi:hypothetical protein
VGDDIGAVAERLRLVRRARRKFLRLWAIDRSMIDPLVDRLVIDLGDLPLPQQSDSAAHPDLPPVDES